MSIINLRSFRSTARHRKKKYRKFLNHLEKNTPRKLDMMTAIVDREVWTEVDCLSCANCCKVMSPTYTLSDIKRISAHLGMTKDEFKKEWLYQEKKSGDWLNRSTPCQFLNQADNKCGIYDVRPIDCSGFPHLPKKRMVEYLHVHKQNIEFCPATLKMVEKMMKLVNEPTVTFLK